MSEFDFWNIDRCEWKEQGLFTGFLKKFSFGQMGPKMAHPHNYGSAVRIFFKFCTMKETTVGRRK